MLLSSRAIPVEVHGGGRFVVPAREFEPAYLETYEDGRLREKVDEALEALRRCTLCPRNCGVNRLEDRFAVCRVGRHARVASFFHHFGEEDVLRGWRGSGTIFFSWCNLKCAFCLHPDTRVLTDQGARRIEDLFEGAVGEIALNGGVVRYGRGLRAFTRDGALAPVVKVFRHFYRGQMVVLKPYGLPSLMVTPDHEVFAGRIGGAAIERVPAGALTRSHFLVVPTLKPPADGAVVDVRRLLAGRVGRFRRPARRRVPLTKVLEMAGVGTARAMTSRQVADVLGYHSAYVRTLLSRIRRGLVDDEPDARNDLVEEAGRIRFKTEKGIGIQTHLSLDTDLARLLGYYCAEGHVRTARDRPNSHHLVFSYGRHETDLASRTRVLLQKVFGLTTVTRTRRTTVVVEGGGSSLALVFSLLCGARARDKRVPPILMTAPTETVRAFLEAYFEGDGSMRPTYVAVNTVSQDLAYGVVALLLRLGVFPYFYPTPRRAEQTIEGRRIRQSSTLYYVKCRREAWEGVPRAQRLRHTECGDTFHVPIRATSRTWYEGPVYNLEMADGDHSYVAHGVAVGNCQNYETSQLGEGLEVGPGDLARMMLHLQAEGCHNINLVTPEHVVPQILEALLPAVRGGLRIPLVYNTSAYDSPHSLRLLDGVVDIYMPDFKLWDREASRRYLLAPDYPDAARVALRAMHDQVGVLKVDEDGVAVRGVLVRHLVMPAMPDDTRQIMGFLAGLSRDTFVNVMDQYAPAWRARTEERFRPINRRITDRELAEAFALARAAGLWRFDTRWRRVGLRDLHAL